MVKEAELRMTTAPSTSRTVIVEQWVLFALLLILCCLSAAGCRRSGPERAIVTGAVTYQGKPLPEGQIRFVPAPGTHAPTAGAFVIDGRYTADGKGGVPVGTHKVMIEAYRLVGPTQPTDLPGQAPETAPGRQQILPSKYNAKTELEITIEPGARRITRNFELTD